MPTMRPRHSITETPRLQGALDDLRRAIGAARVDLAELVVLGAREKLARVRREAAANARLRAELAELIRARRLPVDADAAEEVRRGGWPRR